MLSRLVAGHSVLVNLCPKESTHRNRYSPCENCGKLTRDRLCHRCECESMKLATEQAALADTR